MTSSRSPGLHLPPKEATRNLQGRHCRKTGEFRVPTCRKVSQLIDRSLVPNTLVKSSRTMVEKESYSENDEQSSASSNSESLPKSVREATDPSTSLARSIPGKCAL
jgi:hypothetical protein